MGTYTIQRGDTLNKIASMYGTTADALASSNGIKNKNLIYAGHTLNIPDAVQSVATQVASPTVASTPTPTYTAPKPTYSPSAQLQQAQANISTVKANKPGAYTSTYQGQIDGLLNKILNREKFSYDVTSDAQYNLLKDSYMNKGKTDMMNTQAQAVANTGGYGNSYATTAGSQAYQSAMSNLSSAVPTLQAQALEKYNNDGTALNNNLSAIQGVENTNYSKYRDKVSDYNNEYDLAYQLYNDLYNKEYGSYRDNVSDFYNDQGYSYNAAQDKVTQANLERELAYKLSRL